MDDLFLKQSTLVPDNEIWVSPKTYDDPFSKYTKELGASTNSAMVPCPKYFISAKCAIGFNRDCGISGACRVAQHQ